MARDLVLAGVLVAALACEGASARRERVLAAAGRAESEGDLGRAAALLEAAGARDPRDAAIVARRAAIELERNRPGSAARVLAALPADVPESLDLRRVRARALLRLGDCHDGVRLAVALSAAGSGDELLTSDAVAAVRADWSRCEDTLGTLPRAWLERLVDRLLCDDEPTKALAAWRRLPAEGGERNALAERIVAGLLRQPPSDVVAGSPEIVAPPLSPAKLLLTHRAAVAGGRWKDATAAEISFARLFPSTSPSYEMLLSIARRELNTGQAHEALADAERALELRPTGVEALVESGLALNALGRGREARGMFAGVLAADPGNALALRVLQGSGEDDPASPSDPRVRGPRRKRP